MNGMNLQGGWGGDVNPLVERSWKCTNPLSAYASATAAGMNTRRSHGLLVAPVDGESEKVVILSRVEETLGGPEGSKTNLGCSAYPGTLFPHGDRYIREFRDRPYPHWTYAGEGWVLEKEVHLLEGQNTVLLVYRLASACGPMELSLRPMFALRGESELMYQWLGKKLRAERVAKQEYCLRPTWRSPGAYFALDGEFQGSGYWNYNNLYRASDGTEEGLEDLWSPGEGKWKLTAGQEAHFACSAEPVSLASAMKLLRRQSRAGRKGIRAGKVKISEAISAAKPHPEFSPARAGRKGRRPLRRGEAGE